MKKVIFPLLLLCIVAGAANAQKVQFSIKAGLAFASQSLDDDAVISTNSITTYYIYAVGRANIKGNYFLQTGLGLTGKGVITYQNSQTSTYKLTYMDIPIDVLYKVNVPHLGNAYFGAGPYFSIGLSGNLQTLATSVSNESLAFGASDDYKTVDYGIHFTSNLELNNRLTFNINYEMGVNNLATESQIAGGTLSIKNQVFGIGLGLIF